MFDGGVFRGPLGPELGPAWSTALTAGSVVCAVLAIASFAVGFSFLIVAILVAESMLLCAVYLAYRAVAPNDVDLEQQSAGYLASVICLLLIISSVAFGLSFLVVPIVIGELLLLGGVYLAGRALSPGNMEAERRHPGWYARREPGSYPRAQAAWYARPRNTVRVSERLYKRYPRRRPAGRSRRQPTTAGHGAASISVS